VPERSRHMANDMNYIDNIRYVGTIYYSIWCRRYDIRRRHDIILRSFLYRDVFFDNDCVDT